MGGVAGPVDIVFDPHVSQAIGWRGRRSNPTTNSSEPIGVSR